MTVYNILDSISASVIFDNVVDKIAPAIGRTFNFYDFFQKFLLEFERDYIQMCLVHYGKDSGIMANVHADMASWIGSNAAALHVVKATPSTVSVTTIHGTTSLVSNWERI